MHFQGNYLNSIACPVTTHTIIEYIYRSWNVIVGSSSLEGDNESRQVMCWVLHDNDTPTLSVMDPFLPEEELIQQHLPS